MGVEAVFGYSQNERLVYCLYTGIFMGDYDIKQLNNRHYKLLELCLRGVMSNKEMAAALGMSEQNISIVTNSSSFQHELAIRRAAINEKVDAAIVEAGDEVTETIRSGALEAAKRLCVLRDSTDEQVASRACENILDRSGHPRVMKSEQKSLSITIDAKDIALLNETLTLIGA
jgi:hypothetical protein